MAQGTDEDLASHIKENPNAIQIQRQDLIRSKVPSNFSQRMAMETPGMEKTRPSILNLKSRRSGVNAFSDGCLQLPIKTLAIN